jgi:phage repressor protein C with HTH and peptisase S24 domain
LRKTQAEFARDLGVSRGAVANWETGGKISRTNLGEISQKFDVSMDWLEKAVGKPPGTPPERNFPQTGLDQSQMSVPHDRTNSAYQANASVLSTPVGMWQKIPVYGQAVAGVDGEFVMNGNVLFEAFAPPSLAATANAYGVRVSGESMEPRYFDGEVVFVDPSRTPRAGDFVVVQVHMEEHGELWGFVKRFVRRNNKELVLHQLNPDKQLIFPYATVHTVHVIVMGGMG